MYRKVLVESAPLTPELAAQFGALPPLPGERERRRSRVDYLGAQVLRRKFSGTDWAQGRDLSTGTVYRLDGQHSVHVLRHLPSGAEFPENVLATITTYEFDSMADAADVFNLFNNPKSTRNTEDMMGTYKAQVPELDTYSRKFLVAVGNGIFEYEKKRRIDRKAKDTVELELRHRGLYFTWKDRPEFMDYTHWLASFREFKNASFLNENTIVAEMIATKATDTGAAEAFWPLVFSEGHSDPDHETRALAEWLREQLAVSKRAKLDKGSLRRKTSRAWRQFRAAETSAAA